jgi:hypothetical protein
MHHLELLKKLIAIECNSIAAKVNNTMQLIYILIVVCYIKLMAKNGYQAVDN